MAETSFADKVYEVTQAIPKGKVMTYGDIALRMGNPCYARAVGNALHHNPKEGVIPCHRVVNGQGRLAEHFGFGGLEVQQRMLESEGIEVINGRVDLKRYRMR